jgi:hypothetical protein
VKKIIALFIIVSSLGFAQDSESHKGFYFSLTGGLAFGPITLNATNSTFSTLEANGAGFQYDVKIGAVVSEDENLILSLDAIGRAISAPSWTLDDTAVYSTSSVSASDAMYGIGITKYFMPSNMFVSGTFGLGKFQINYANSKVTSHSGFAFQLKGGKEWWVSDDWEFGISVGFAHIAADDQSDPANPGYSGKLSSIKAFLGFSVTYN